MEDKKIEDPTDEELIKVFGTEIVALLRSIQKKRQDMTKQRDQKIINRRNQLENRK